MIAIFSKKIYNENIMRTYELTKKEEETYSFILNFQKKFGKFPLLSEIAHGIGTVSKGVAHRYVQALVNYGKIEKIRYKHR